MINYITSPFRWFFKLEAASGLLLLISAIIALIISNSNFSSLYFEILESYFFVGINNFGIELSLLHWINDALMAIFFFFVTLEIKREFLQGELSNRKQALLPIIAAIGGMLVPALLYVYINFSNNETLNGWDKPTAGISDISKLPREARAYVSRLEELINCPVDIISTGPHRDQTIMLKSVI